MQVHFKMPSLVWLKRGVYTLIVLFSFAFLAKVAELFLAHNGVSYQEKNRFVDRHIYRISGLFFDKKEAAALASAKTDAKSATEAAVPLKSWVLKALFSDGDDGFAVVVVSGKTQYLNIGESHKGYTLDSIKGKNAYLMRSGKQYKLSLEAKESDIKFEQQKRKVPYQNVKPEKLDVKALNEGIVRRAEIERRMKRPDLIWKDIKISIYRKGGDIAGFIVRSVKHNSIFHHLGLKRGDIIVSANGTTLDSLEGVQELYKNVDKMTSLVLGVKRSGKIEELTYEIK